MGEDDFNFSGRDWRDLSPQQWTEARREIICRAHSMRSQAARKFAVFVFTSFVDALRFVRGRYASLKAAQIERHAIARLQSLDDHALSDIGIRRSEIESIVNAKGCDVTRRRGNCPVAA